MLVFAFLQVDPSAISSPLPVDSPIGGPFWSYVVPAAVFLISVIATLALYRHFSRQSKRTGV